jgi:hypothetical protein
VSRTWTEVGEQLFDADRANREGHLYAAGRGTVAAAIERLDWVDVPDDGTAIRMPFSPGEGIKSLMSGIGLHNPRRIAWSGGVPVRDDVEHARSEYGLYGVEVPAKGGLLRVFAVDRGTDLFVVAFDEVAA